MRAEDFEVPGAEFYVEDLTGSSIRVVCEAEPSGHPLGGVYDVGRVLDRDEAERLCDWLNLWLAGAPPKEGEADA